MTFFSLGNRHILVSGGAGLLGPYFSESLLVAGANVSLLDIESHSLKQVVERLQPKFGERIKGYCCDITNSTEVADIIDRIEQDQPIYGLVNAAAIDPKTDTLNIDEIEGDFLSYSVDQWRLSMDVNITGTFILSQAVGRQLMARNVGAIVNVSSTYGLSGPDQTLYEEGCPGRRFKKPGDYPTSKAAVIGFSRYLAAYFSGTNIRVNCLVPGGVYNGHSKEFVEAYSARTIMKRMAQPTEFGGALVFLLSDASSYVTGTTLIVDGGWTAL